MERWRSYPFAQFFSSNELYRFRQRTTPTKGDNQLTEREAAPPAPVTAHTALFQPAPPKAKPLPSPAERPLLSPRSPCTSWLRSGTPRRSALSAASPALLPAAPSAPPPGYTAHLHSALPLDALGEAAPPSAAPPRCPCVSRAERVGPGLPASWKRPCGRKAEAARAVREQKASVCGTRASARRRQISGLCEAQSAPEAPLRIGLACHWGQNVQRSLCTRRAACLNCSQTPEDGWPQPLHSAQEGHWEMNCLLFARAGP